MTWLFLFFCVSGFCSILYEIVWLRLAAADFGVTSALVSIVLSAFMAGLGLGAWGSGYLIRKHEERLRGSALALYGFTEILIGVSAILVGDQLALGRTLLERVGVFSSASYYLASGVWVALTLIPWCACMGATIPLAMFAIRNRYPCEAQRSFSYLYAANVLGATLGTILPLFLVELRGFHGTLRVGAVLNSVLGVTAILIWRRWPLPTNEHREKVPIKPVHNAPVRWRPLVLLFIGGLTSMGAEIVWIRQFTPYLGTMVYAFASILGVYLLSTFVGSWVYRRRDIKNAAGGALLWSFLGLALLLPLATADPSIRLWQDVITLGYLMGVLRVLAGITPFCALLGFVTPMLVDHWAGGSPDKAGNAYAINVLGCIVGPLLSGFLLLPYFSERWVLFAFSLLWLAMGLASEWMPGREEETGHTWRLRTSLSIVVLELGLVVFTKGYETRFPKHAILRDNAATTMAVGEGDRKDLLVNGRGMTGLTPVTKMMAHLPLASLDHPPKNGLVICFGMGTTFRSMLSWKIETTAVELVPGVPRVFWYFHSDAQKLLSSPLAHVEIDDGRRYLERTAQQYDVITIDPPPPVQSAGSSLLYSKEFYSIIKQRLKPGGILQQWLPTGDKVTQAAIARALRESFAQVRAFRGVTGWGAHFLASDSAFARKNADELAAGMPSTAAKDMTEWGPYSTPRLQFAAMLDTELPLDRFLAASPATPAMRDDTPVNEYFLLRLLGGALRTAFR